MATRALRWLRAALGLILGASVPGCALVMAAASQVQLYQRNSVTNLSGGLDPAEIRTSESCVIYKVGSSFSVAGASVDEIVPAATSAIGTWPDAEQLPFKFGFPPAS